MKYDLVEFINTCPLTPKMIYTDIPWNSGNCKYWRTMANRADSTIGSYHVDYMDFLSKLKTQLFYLTKPTYDYMFIEAGISGYWMVEECFKGLFKKENTFTTYYNRGIEQRLLYYTNDDCSFNVEGLHDAYFVDECFKKADDCVFDPCVGLGTSLKKAAQYGVDGMFFDLNKERLSKTMKILLKKGYCVESVYG